MEIEQSQIGWEFSSQEWGFVQKIIFEIRRTYEGPIRVVGSRKDAQRFSKKKINVYLQDLDELNPGQCQRWATLLNQIARENDIPAGRIREVLKLVTEPIPEEVKRLFESPSPIDADLDLAIDEPRGSIKANYYDEQPPEGSGLVIEIYEPGDTSYISTDLYQF